MVRPGLKSRGKCIHNSKQLTLQMKAKETAYSEDVNASAVWR